MRIERGECNFHVGRIAQLLKDTKNKLPLFSKQKKKVLLPYRRQTLVTNTSFLFLKSSYPFFFPPKDSEEVPEQAESHLDIFSKHSFYAFLLHDNIAWILNLILFHHIFYGLAQINLFIRLKKKHKKKNYHIQLPLWGVATRNPLYSLLFLFFFFLVFFFSVNAYCKPPIPRVSWDPWFWCKFFRHI